MKFWLVLMIFNLNGHFLYKKEIPFKNRVECLEAAGQKAKKFVNKSVAISSFCVTDNHHRGISVDPGIPLD